MTPNSITPFDQGVVSPTPESRALSGLASMPQPVVPLADSGVVDRSPDLLDVAAATWRRETLLGQLFSGTGFRPQDEDPTHYSKSWNPYAFFAANRDQYADVEDKVLDGTFEHIYSPDGFNRLVTAIRKSKADEAIMAQGGFSGAAVGMAASLFDVTTLLPFGGARSATRLGSAVKLATMTAGQQAVQELALRQFDPARTNYESFMNIGVGAVLGAGIGTLAHHVPPELRPGAERNPLDVKNPPAEFVGEYKPGATPEEVAKFPADSVGAARVSDEELRLAGSDSKVAQKIMDGVDASFGAVGPLGRLRNYVGPGFRALADLMDGAGRWTKGNLAGKGNGIEAEAYEFLAAQRLRTIQKDLERDYIEANMAAGQSGAGTKAKMGLAGLTLDKADFNRVPKSVFMDAARRRLTANMFEGEAHVAAKNVWYQRLEQALKDHGIEDKAVRETVIQKVNQAAERAQRFWDEQGAEAVSSGLLDPDKMLGKRYGHAILYNASAIRENKAGFRNILLQMLGEKPSDDFLAEFASRHPKDPAAPDGARMTPEDLKNDPHLWDQAVLEWAGDKETDMARRAAASLEDSSRRMNQAMDELELLLEGKKSSGKELEKRTLGRLRAKVRESLLRDFDRRLSNAAKNLSVWGSRQEELEKVLADLAAKHPQAEAQAAGDVLDAAGPRVVSREADLADALTVVDESKRARDKAANERKAALTDLRGVKAMIAHLENVVGTEARYQLRLLGNQAEGIEARLVPEAMEDLDTIQMLKQWGEYRRDANEVLGLARQLENLAASEHQAAKAQATRARRRLDAMKQEFDQAARTVGTANREIEKIAKNADELAAKREKGMDLVEEIADETNSTWRDAVQSLHDAEQARKNASNEYAMMRKAVGMTRRELRAVRRDWTKARNLTTRLAKGKGLEAYVDDLIEKLTDGKRPPADATLMVPAPKSGRLMERRLPHSFDTLEQMAEHGFIENDLVTMLERSNADVGSKVALKRRFADDDLALSNTIRDAEGYYDRLIEQAQQAGNEKLADHWRRLRKTNIEDIHAIRDRILGRRFIGGADEDIVTWGAGQVRQTAFNAYGVGFILSAPLDIITSLLQTTGAVKHFLSAGRDYRKLIQAARAGDESKRMLQVAMESMEAGAHSGTSLNAYGGGTSRFAQGFGDGLTRRVSSRFERVNRMIGEKVNQWSMMAAWSDKWRRAVGFATLHDLADDLPKYASLPQARKADLATLGIGEGEAAQIAALFKKHGKREGSLLNPGLAHWGAEPGGDYLAQLLQAALVKTQRRAVMVPGYGTQPLLVDKWWGAMFLQFQSHMMQFSHTYVAGAVQRGLTLGQIRYGLGLIASLGMAVPLVEMRAALSGKDTSQWSDSKYAWEVVNRSGVLGWVQTPFDVFSMSAGQLVNDALGTEVFTHAEKYADRNALSSLAGPGAGVLGRAGEAATALARGEVEQAREKAYRLMPFRQAFDIFHTLNQEF